MPPICDVTVVITEVRVSFQPSLLKNLAFARVPPTGIKATLNWRSTGIGIGIPP